MESAPDPVRFDDLPYRLVGALLLGVGIGFFTGLYRGAVPSQPVFWAATAWFVVTSCVIWEGNRWLWSRVRGTSNWLDRPVRRVAGAGEPAVDCRCLRGVAGTWGADAGASGARVGTHPEQHAGDVGWCRFYCPQPFIVHSQETAYLICERRRERDERSGLEVARAKAELAALTAQVDPHFVFNSLHTIIELNQESPELATEFAVALADVYRYVVQHGKRDLVPLAEELGLLEKYALLLRTRFGDGISVRLPKPSRGTHTGLINRDQRCKLICGPGIEIQEDGSSFAVVVPLL